MGLRGLVAVWAFFAALALAGCLGAPPEPLFSFFVPEASFVWNVESRDGGPLPDFDVPEGVDTLTVHGSLRNPMDDAMWRFWCSPCNDRKDVDATRISSRLDLSLFHSPENQNATLWARLPLQRGEYVHVVVDDVPSGRYRLTLRIDQGYYNGPYAVAVTPGTESVDALVFRYETVPKIVGWSVFSLLVAALAVAAGRWQWLRKRGSKAPAVVTRAPEPPPGPLEKVSPRNTSGVDWADLRKKIRSTKDHVQPDDRDRDSPPTRR